MTAEIVDGKAIADVVMTGLAEQLSALGEPLRLAALCVGDDVGLRSFVKLKQKAAQSIGAEFSSYFFDANDEDGARQTLQYLVGDEGVHGIFVELPLPVSWNSAALLSLIPAQKDVDVLSPHTQKMFYENHGAVVPSSVLALKYVLHAHEIAIRDMRIAMVGAGELVGKPVAHWLAQQGARVDIIDINTPHPSEISRQAEMVIAATGTPGLVTDEWIREGAIVIDYGFAKKGTAYFGDVDFASAHKKAGLLTPVPGGMGPLVVSAVLENLIVLVTHI
ncbi:MAG: bifunctional 5,10-methylenetetrahydrofolate dehydrogenase/5,10-methenyltetrahydrofolate cyclohydrolase [Patescibacteria group bacterium]